jgi:hypothetical protein
MDAWPGEFRLAPPEPLIVDHGFQREEKPALIGRIASAFDWRAFGVLTAFERATGELYLADGQQRRAGALACPTPPIVVPIVVYPVSANGRSEAEIEAAVFVAINEYRIALNSFEKHRAKVVARDPATLAIEAAVARAGFTTGRSWGGDSHTIGAVSTLRWAYNYASEEGLESTLLVIRDAWPDDRQALTARIIRLVALLVVDVGDPTKVTKGLARTTPVRLMRKAEELRFAMGGSPEKNLRRAARDLVRLGTPDAS